MSTWLNKNRVWLDIALLLVAFSVAWGALKQEQKNQKEDIVEMKCKIDKIYEYIIEGKLQK